MQESRGRRSETGSGLSKKIGERLRDFDPSRPCTPTGMQNIGLPWMRVVVLAAAASPLPKVYMVVQK